MKILKLPKESLKAISTISKNEQELDAIASVEVKTVMKKS